jgi:hypothetical protein
MPEGRIRIALAAGELEVEGTTEFVAGYDDAIRGMLTRLRDRQVPSAGQGNSATPETSGAGPVSTSESREERQFGEVVHALPKGASGTDQILLAGYFASRSNSESTFSTAEANRLLVEQGIKLANASQSLKNNMSAKRVFKVGNRFRVSRTGEQHVQSLIS